MYSGLRCCAFVVGFWQGSHRSIPSSLVQLLLVLQVSSWLPVEGTSELLQTAEPCAGNEFSRMLSCESATVLSNAGGPALSASWKLHRMKKPRPLSGRGFVKSAIHLNLLVQLLFDRFLGVLGA